MFVTNSVFKNNNAWGCAAINYQALNTASSKVIIKDSKFDNNQASNYCYTNNQCNRHGSVCFWGSLANVDGSILEYSITNVTFTNNVGCSSGEAFTIHLGNDAVNGNCYANNGMRCYTNGYYSAIPCYTQYCNQKNNQLPSLAVTCSTEWIPAYSITSGNVISTLGESMDSMFQKSGIFYRNCSNCVDSHRDIYYKRITPIPSQFSMYHSILQTWYSTNNVLNLDFYLYSSWSDLQMMLIDGSIVITMI